MSDDAGLFTRDTRTALTVVSALQLVAGVGGQAVALRRRLAYDVPPLRMQGRPQDVA